MAATTETDPDIEADEADGAATTGETDDAPDGAGEADPADETGEAQVGDDAEAEAPAEDDAGDDDLRLKGKGAKKNRVRLRDRPWGRYARRSIMPVLLALSLTLSSFLGWLQWQHWRVDEAGKQARQAAIAYADVLTSIDSSNPANLDKNFQQVLDGATGEFKDQYTQSSVQLRQLLVDNKATAHGTVVDSAIMSASPDRVEVMLFIDQTVTNTKMSDPRIDRSRIKMTMEKVDGRWRAAKVQLL